MDRGKNKADVRHIASQPFSPSLSKRFFSPPFPSIQKSSINSYLNGTPVNNRRQALEMWVRLKLICRECYLVQQFFVNYIVATARQLRISKGGTMGRMNLCQPYKAAFSFASSPRLGLTFSLGKHPRLIRQKMYSRTRGVLPWTRRICHHHLQDILHSQPQHQFYGPRMTTSRIWKTSSTGTYVSYVGLVLPRSMAVL